MKKILTGVILVCLLCIGLVACPQHIAAETKDTGVFSGEVTLLKEENHAYVYQVSLENHGVDFEGTSRVIFKRMQRIHIVHLICQLFCRQMAKSSIR